MFCTIIVTNIIKIFRWYLYTADLEIGFTAQLIPVAGEILSVSRISTGSVSFKSGSTLSRTNITGRDQLSSFKVTNPFAGISFETLLTL